MKQPMSWALQRCYMVWTVSHYFTGRLVLVTPTELVFEDGAWIPDTGRLNECLTTGTVTECEPVPTEELIIQRSAVIAAFGWSHPLPRKVK